MEQLLLEFGLKDGIFVGLFVWLFMYVLRTTRERENKLFGFLDDMKVEFAKLVGSYESLSNNVEKIEKELHNKMDKNKGE